MASELSKGRCIEALDEKEEGEISLEDVSSSEEGHGNYAYGSGVGRCPNCLSTHHGAAWCTAPIRHYYPPTHNRRDPVQGKENRHHVKEAGCTGAKHNASTLQEKNDDLVPISSDSDMEIVGLADNSKQIVIHGASKSRLKKKKKKKRTHAPVLTIDDLVTPSSVDEPLTKCVGTVKHEHAVTKTTALSRTHRRDASPIHRSSRTRVGPRSPSRRHRSPVRPRSPIKRSRSPVTRAHSPIIRRSPKRVKSPKRSPPRNACRKMSDLQRSIDLHTYVDTQKLLKKVRQLKAVGTQSLEATLHKNKENASSLKEKLSIMMKGMSDNNGNITSNSKEMSIISVKEKIGINAKEINDADDEEDLALLRQQALQTKQNKLNKHDRTGDEVVKKVPTNANDDQDEEDLELRMIALRSAVLKQHQKRIQKGMKRGKCKKSDPSRSDSPFTQSFLDSIPIPGEELSNLASPPCTPSSVSGSNHTEDMELDTDVEREKERLPYSPTDKIITNVPIDTELLGIQPSDVSFICVTETNGSPIFNTSFPRDDSKILQGKIVENLSYLSNAMYRTPPRNVLYEATNANVPYSPSDPTETPTIDFTKKHNMHLSLHNYAANCNTLKNNTAHHPADNISSQEMPYSPTDTPTYDPDLVHGFTQTPVSCVTSDSSFGHTNTSMEQYNLMFANSQAEIAERTKNFLEDNHSDKMDAVSLDPAVGSASPLTGSASPTCSMITIDDLPETDMDASPLATDSLKTINTMGDISDHLSDNVKVDRTLEPLYMKGLPDITKDANKIPTLINRTLVPATILKTNKQLQQPLPTKKQEMHPEPTFKSAEMQPVAINEETHVKTNTLFKPMKLVPFAQKSQSKLTTPTAFHDAMQDETTNAASMNKHTSLLESPNRDATRVQNTLTMDANDSDKICDITFSSQKRNRVNKKGMKRKSISTMQSASKKSSTCTNQDDTDVGCRKEINVTKPNQMEEQERYIRVSENLEKNKQKVNSMDITDNIAKNSTEINITSKTNIEGHVREDTLSTTTANQIKSTVNRRESLDEDEEALRAILLASLPKRGKVPENNAPNVTTATAKSTIPNCKQQTFTRQIPPKAVSSPVGATTSTKISENDKTVLNSAAKMSSTIKKGDASNGIAGVTLTSANSVKKRQIPMTKGPQKKVMRKISIPASTKVVNNAKRYQNAIVQKRLNLQKATTLYNQKILESKIASKRQRNENKWSAKTKTSLISDTQRIVINLESDAESDSESEQQNKEVDSSPNSAAMEKHQPPINSTAEFEKNLDQFLRDVRKKQESVASARPTPSSPTTAKPTTPMAQVEKKSSSNLHTPLAVRHLPASQQEEYRRLKQQILEREKLRLRRTIENNNSLKNKAAGTAQKIAQSPNSNKEQPSSKINPTVPQKNQILSTQQLSKGSTVKPLASSKSTVNDSKQESSPPLRAKTLSKSVPNLSIRVVTTESTISPSNTGNRIVSSSVPPLSKSRAVLANVTHTSDETAKTKNALGLKILSKDEVNRKFVQIRVKQDTNERVVTINEKLALNDKEQVDRNEVIPENKSVRDKDVTDHVPERLIETREKEKENIVNDAQGGNKEDLVDSDASTVVLPRAGESTDREASLTTTESTILLSDYQEKTRTQSSTESTENCSFLSPRRSPEARGSIGENWDAIKKDVKTELSALAKLPRMEQKQQLMDTEQKLVMKRYMVLDELAEMSGDLRQWNMERDLQTHLVAEVRKLRAQLAIAEQKLQEQRDRINSIGPKVMAAHGRINVGRQDCFRLSKICSALGSTVVGKEYKVPEAGAQLLDNRIKEVASHTRQLSRKKVPSIHIPEVCTPSLRKSLNNSLTDMASEGSDVDESGATVSTANECSMDTNEGEITVQPEFISVDANEPSEQNEDVVSNDLTIHENEQSTREQHVDAFDAQPQLSSTPLVSKDSNDQLLEQSLENVRPIASLGKKRLTGQDGQNAKKTPLPYVSILSHFKVPRNTNPNGVLCPYELMGTCKDNDCQYVHQSESEAV